MESGVVYSMMSSFAAIYSRARKYSLYMELFCDRELYKIYAPHFAHKLTAIHLDKGWKWHI